MEQEDFTTSGEDEGGLVTPWEPQRHVRAIDAREVRLSRGFLRCRPEKWFPSFPTLWLPLGHSVGVELKVTEIKPVLDVPENLEVHFLGSIDDELIAVQADTRSASILQEAICPGAFRPAGEVVLDYLVRRFFSTISTAWTGPRSSVVRFESEAGHQRVEGAGAIKFVLSINGTTCSFWIVLGKLVVERLDGLWRRQMQSSVKNSDELIDARIQVSQLAVPPATLVDYIKPGSEIDLEIPLSDRVIIRAEGRTPLSARLRAMGDRFALELLSGQAPALALPEGTTRLGIEFGTLSLSNGMWAELSQPGVIWETDVALTRMVSMSVNNEKVADAELGVYEGRFALSVL